MTTLSGLFHTSAKNLARLCDLTLMHLCEDNILFIYICKDVFVGTRGEQSIKPEKRETSQTQRRVQLFCSQTSLSGNAVTIEAIFTRAPTARFSHERTGASWKRLKKIDCVEKLRVAGGVNKSEIYGGWPRQDVSYKL